MEQKVTSDGFRTAYDEAQLAAHQFIIENRDMEPFKMIMYAEFIIHNVLNQRSEFKNLLENLRHFLQGKAAIKFRQRQFQRNQNLKSRDISKMEGTGKVSMEEFNKIFDEEQLRANDFLIEHRKDMQPHQIIVFANFLIGSAIQRGIGPDRIFLEGFDESFRELLKKKYQNGEFKEFKI